MNPSVGSMGPQAAAEYKISRVRLKLKRAKTTKEAIS